jgi:hypothetical protein
VGEGFLRCGPRVVCGFLRRGRGPSGVCADVAGRVARPHRKRSHSLLPLHFSRSLLFFYLCFLSFSYITNFLKFDLVIIRRGSQRIRRLSSPDPVPVRPRRAAPGRHRRPPRTSPADLALPPPPAGASPGKALGARWRRRISSARPGQGGGAPLRPTDVDLAALRRLGARL